MSQDNAAQDPLEFVRGMWNNMGFALPGMVTPTLDVDELDKRISDLKTVENWLKMNLNMLQMTIQGLEMQRVAIAAVKAMSEQATESRAQGDATEGNPFAAAALWPWTMMQQAQEASTAPEAQPDTGPRKAKPRTRAGARKPTGK
ncbi:MAG: hypothetical protein KJZ96_14740 [Rhodocyclaceae bacterium]|jgi:hypothetical protein|nr:hypothetical protein [Rhodocyclaceae bacterium]MCL4759589.1 hypothetical protein [Rhodocyclaceae bacterium]